MVLPSRNRLAAPRAAVLYGIPPASSLPQNLNRKRRQILADPGSRAHGQDDPEGTVECIATGGQLARGGPIGGKDGGVTGGELLVAERHAHDRGHRLLPHRLALAILRPNMERLYAADLVVDRPGHGQRQVHRAAGRQRGRRRLRLEWTVGARHSAGRAPSRGLGSAAGDEQSDEEQPDTFHAPMTRPGRKSSPGQAASQEAGASSISPSSE